ncbi:MAG: hypothetical protein LBK58_05565 [Prevotellaceae bacterium]|jgi:hypothetical protein|nr:hypothetical protein [Prevotellaceae bacterium]
MKKRICMMVTGVVFILHGYAQTNGDEHKIPKQSSPANLANYRLTIDVTEREMNGKFLKRNISSGKIIELSRVSIVDNTIQLEDVSATGISEQGQMNTRKLDELEGLNFKILGDNFTSLDFYKNFPPAQTELIRTIIQDRVTFEVWGQMYLDSLRLNTSFHPDLFKNHQADFEQTGNFNTQKLNITWLGYSKINGKDCILVYFKSMYSPFQVDNDTMTVSGRSCFWGKIWILPDTRQIEYAVMNEDMLSHIKLKVNDFEQQFNKQREVIYEKVE